jgi:DNA-binding transcriptional ArsR family regulator
MNTIETTSSDVLEALFKAFSHPARLAILEELRKGEHCVCHLEALLEARQSYVSQQLAVLREAGLISDRRDGLECVLPGQRHPRI